MNTQKLVTEIISNTETQNLLKKHNLRAHLVTWEDTARGKNTCWGPNISDMTLVVKDGTMMPVIRTPNFADETQDVPIDTFKIPVGNERNSPLQHVSLKNYLQNVTQNVTDNNNPMNLLHERDSVILTSSQCCVLPVHKDKTEFAVQLFNYQSFDKNPAVLVILVSKNGTSTQVIEESNQKLFFNDNGTARWFTAERLEDVRTRRGESKTRVSSFKEMKTEEKMDNVLMMFQVPLKVKENPRKFKGYSLQSAVYSNFDGCEITSRGCCSKLSKGMDMAQLGLGAKEGEFVGTKGLKLERDERFPIRCTFQYYRVTDEDHISENSVNDIAEQLQQANRMATSFGSLVTSTTERVTEPDLKNTKATDCPFVKYYPGVATPSMFHESLATFIQ